MKSPDFPQKFNQKSIREHLEDFDLMEIKNIQTPTNTKETPKSGKEKIFDFLKYKSLKLKEYFGQLNQADFNELLDIDFEEQLRENLPIKGVFSPEEELEIIKILPRELKRRSLQTFKEKLARQREALGTLRVFIERSIEFNHDVPREKLMGLIEKFSSYYGFDDNQRKISEKLIDGYYEKRKEVLAIRKQFPDDYELIRKLSGVNLGKEEKLNISVGPMSIDIDTGEFNSGQLYKRTNSPIALRYGGFASESVNGIYFTVLNRNAFNREPKWYGGSNGEKIVKHEQEHEKNKLFQDIFRIKLHRPTLWLNVYKSEEDLENKEIILKEFLSDSRVVALERAKDEITASLVDMGLPKLQQNLSWLFLDKRNDSYDYLAYLRNKEEFKDNALYQETVEKMLVQEYREIIEKAVNAYAELVNQGKYSIQEATALLTDKPLETWPKTIKRFLEYK
ncbi:MAG: hypothetical protein WC059_00180 [Candidatus Paceibacterota bacterium]